MSAARHAWELADPDGNIRRAMKGIDVAAPVAPLGELVRELYAVDPSVVIRAIWGSPRYELTEQGREALDRAIVTQKEN